MKLALKLNGEEKIYSADYIKARMFRKALQLTQEINFADIKLDGLDKMVSFVCEVFDNKFSIDDFYDGIESDEAITIMFRIINSILERTSKTIELFPNAQAEK